MQRLATVLTIGLLLAACGVDSDSKNGSNSSETESTTSTVPATTEVVDTTAVATTSVESTVPAPTTTPQSFVDRPLNVIVPDTYDAATAAPLVILLHGYGAVGSLQEIYFNLRSQAEERGFLYVYPDATPNRLGINGWNATDACCNDSDVDDSAYITHIIDEVSATYNVDPKRVYLVGHSNGGFMSYRMACDRADRIAAIVSLAGATYLDAAKCAPSEPVSVLQIHGTDDGTIDYEGGTTPLSSYPAAETTVATWSSYNGCASATESLGAIDLNMALAGYETTIQAFTDCPVDGAVELWTMVDGAHIPSLTSNFAADIIDWLFAHPNT